MKKIIVPIIIIIGLIFFFWPGYPPNQFLQSLISKKSPQQQITNRQQTRQINTGDTLETHQMPKLLSLEFKNGVDPSDEGEMRKGFKIIDFYLNKWFGHSISQKSAIVVEPTSSDSKFLIENGKPTFYYRTLSSDWAPIKQFKLMDLRRRAAAHEYIHLYQLNNGCARPNREGEKALWFLEGSAEWLSYKAFEESGNLPSFVSFMGGEKFFSMIMQQVGTETKPLKNYEESGYGRGVSAGHDPGVYSYQALAVGLLVKNNDIKKLDDFCINLGKGQEISVAFQNAFGASLEKFYSDFETYFKNLNKK